MTSVKVVVVFNFSENKMEMKFLLKVLPEIFKHILPSDDFYWTIIIFKLILEQIILCCT
jgi:hypothetical protein